MVASRDSGSLERISSGVKGLDELIEGGYLKGRTILLTGGAGVGKTIMALHFAHSTCKSGAKCIYIASEETPGELRQQANQLGMNIEAFEDSKQLSIIPALIERISDVQWLHEKTPKSLIFREPIESIMKSDADVAVIDNIGAYTVDISIGMFRKQMDHLVNSIREKGMTGLIVCDASVDERYNSIALYSVHGAVHMFKRENPFTGNVERLMNVVKMRGTKTPLEYVKYEIDGEGIKIRETE